MEKLNVRQDHLPVILFCICLHFLSLVTTASGAQYSRPESLFNHTCKSREDCSFQKTYLNCVYERCICSHHEHFDKRDEFCRIKIPSLCVIRRSIENPPCIRDAHCAFPKDNRGYELKTSVTGFCKCLSGQPPKPDGLCSSGGTNMLHSYFIFISSCLVILGVYGSG